MKNNVLDTYLFDAFASASDNIFIFISDVKNQLTRWSKNAVEFFDLEDEYIYDLRSKWIHLIHPDDQEMYLDDFNKVFSGQKERHDVQYRIRNKQGEYVWVVCRGTIRFDDKGTPEVFAGIVTWLENQSKFDNLTHQLTGFELLNKHFDKSGSIMMIGIDRLRDINSRHGLLYGNELIVRLSGLLTEYAKGTEIYRFQGDEFAVYGPGMSSKKMTAIFDKVCKRCGETEKECELINFNVSAGITEFKTEEDITDILAKAELSLTFAKEKSPCVEVYSKEIEEKHTRKHLVSETLIHSINNKCEGFYLVYQPILANTGDTVVGCEALLRWKPNNEMIGNCYPDEFISILEENDGINEVGYFVMRDSIRQASEWQKKYKKFNVSFNVSYKQLEDPNFVPAIIDTIRKYKVDPHYIIVELTESILAADTVMVKKSFELLKKHGVKIALDDFGTGNSSFWMLHNISVDEVKLDQSFIRGLDISGKGIDYAIVESVGIMCNRIGCMTIAEGVETDTIWKMISKFEFTGLQGYLFSRPVEVPDFEKLLSDYNMNLTEEEMALINEKSFDNFVESVKRLVKKIDSSVVKEHLAVEFDIEGKGEGAFYVEFNKDSVESEAYEYYDRDIRIRCSADIAKKLLNAKISLKEAVESKKAIVEGEAEKLLIFEKYIKIKEKVSTKNKKNLKNKK